MKYVSADRTTFLNFENKSFYSYYITLIYVFMWHSNKKPTTLLVRRRKNVNIKKKTSSRCQMIRLGIPIKFPSQRKKNIEIGPETTKLCFN